jgi:uncharacterized protein (TIGR03083 family)
MDHENLLAVAESEGRALILAAESAPTAAVSACPGWTNAELLDHVSWVWSFVAAQVSAGTPDSPARPDDDGPGRPGTELDHLLGLLGAAHPGTATWTWTPDRTVGFFIRRMAHENTIHRWDAEEADGRASPIDAEVAADGIEEVLEVGMAYRSRGGDVEYPSGSLHLHRTDGNGEWLISAVNGRMRVTREHAKGDAAVRGTAKDLLLYLWDRSREGLEYFGDQTVVDAWATVTP